MTSESLPPQLLTSAIPQIATHAIPRAVTRCLTQVFYHDRGRIVMGRKKSRFDPREAYRLCQQYPSAAANVIRAMLLKVGRPHSEVEHAVAESMQKY